MPPTPYHDPTVWAWQLRDSQRDPTATSRRDNGLPSARISGQRGVPKMQLWSASWAHQRSSIWPERCQKMQFWSASWAPQRSKIWPERCQTCNFGVPLGLTSARISGQRGVQKCNFGVPLGLPALEYLAREVSKNAISECLLGSQRSSIWPERCPKCNFGVPLGPPSIAICPHLEKKKISAKQQTTIKSDPPGNEKYVTKR